MRANVPLDNGPAQHCEPVQYCSVPAVFYRDNDGVNFFLTIKIEPWIALVRAGACILDPTCVFFRSLFGRRAVPVGARWE
jgi:hypothetical protein